MIYTGLKDLLQQFKVKESRKSSKHLCSPRYFIRNVFADRCKDSLYEMFSQIDARIVDPGYRASSTQPLLPQHNNVAHSSSLGNSSLAFQSEEGNSESKSLLPTAYSNHGQNEISSSRQNVTFLGVDKSGTLFI